MRVAVSRRGLREISVHHVRYLYRITNEKDGMHLNICILLAGVDGQRLQTGFAEPIDWIVGQAGTWHGRFIEHAVIPGVIRKLILRGIGDGWRPVAKGVFARYLVS